MYLYPVHGATINLAWAVCQAFRFRDTKSPVPPGEESSGTGQMREGGLVGGSLRNARETREDRQHSGK